MSHFFPQKDFAPTRVPLSNDAILWQGAPSGRTVLPSILVCLLFGWLIVPIWFTYRIWLKHSSTEYLVTQRYVQIRNDSFDKVNRILEIYRVRSVEAQSSSSPGKQDVIFYPTDDYTPPVRYVGVEISDEELRRIKDAIDATREKKRVAAISLPVLG
ncbi:MAG: hypothetical protein P9L94_20035 [Candidatus Hinthialibacter antarcticus]|nr:hypothetical protein [Candidatus Hinthialibacter antarcticus]